MNRKFKRLVRKTSAVLGAGAAITATGVIPLIAPVTNVYAADSYDTEKKDYENVLSQAKSVKGLTVKENVEKVTVYESELEAKKAELATKIDAETAKINSAISKQKANNDDYTAKSSDSNYILKEYLNQDMFPRDQMIDFLTDKNGKFSTEGISDFDISNTTTFSSTAKRLTSVNDSKAIKYFVDRDGIDNSIIEVSRFVRGLEFPGNTIDLTNVNKSQFIYFGFVPRKGDKYTFENAFYDEGNGKWVDIIMTLEDFEVVEGAADPVLFVMPYGGIEVFGGLKTVTFNADIVEHGTNSPLSVNLLYNCVDIDCNTFVSTVGGGNFSINPRESGGQAMTVYGAQKAMVPAVLPKGVDRDTQVEINNVSGGFQAIAHADNHLDDNDPEGWASFLLRNVSSFKFKWDDSYANSLKSRTVGLTPDTAQQWLEDGKTNSRTYFLTKPLDGGDYYVSTNASWVGLTKMNIGFRPVRRATTSVSVTSYELEVLPDPQKATITYIDKTTNKTLETKQLDGINNEPFNYTTTDTIKKYTDKGYKLVSSDYPEKEEDQKFDTDPKTDQNYTVILEQRIVNIPPDKPGYGVTEDQLNKTLKRTAYYKYETKDGKDVYEPIEQTVKLTRSATKNLVTGEVTFTKWTEGKMEELITKPKTNYSHDRDKIDAVDPVTVDSKVNDEYVIYNKIPQKGSVDFTDKDTKEEIAKKKTLNGYQAAPFNYTPDETIKTLENQGWDLVSNDFPTDAKEQVYDTDPKTDQDYHVVMTPHIETVPPDKPKVPGTPAREEVPYPEGLEEEDLNKTIKRTIYYKYNNKDGKDVFEPVVQTVKLTRSAKFNYVTGEIVYTPWTEGKMDDVVTKPKEDYTFDRAKVDGVNPVTVSTKVQDEYVIYKKIPQKGSVTFTDKSTGEEVEPKKELNGYNKEPFNYTPDDTIQKLTENGYDLVSNDFPKDPKDQVYDTDTTTDQDYNVVVTPHIETITPDNPKDPGTNPEGRPGVEYPEGLQAKNLNKTLTRTIYYKYNNKDGEDVFEPVKQRVKLTRTATFNYVTKELNYAAWTTGTIKDVKSPDLENYFYDRSNVEGIATVKTDTKMEDQYVIYKKIPQNGSVTFTDRDSGDEVAPKKDLNGYQAEPFNYTPDSTIKKLENQGWDLVSNDFPEDPADQVYDSDTETDQDYNVVVTPHIEVIPPEEPKAPGEPTDRDEVNYPEGVDEDDLNKTYTRTIFYKYESPEGDDVFEPVIQTVRLTRPAIFNYVTGEVAYGEWTTETIEDVESQTKEHWQFDRSVVEGLEITAELEPLEDEYVIYTRVPEKGKVEFVDEEDNPIADTHELNGFDLDPFDYDPKPTIDELHNKGWDLVTNEYPEDPAEQVYDSDPNVDQNFVIIHTPHIETITPDNPKKPGSATDRKDVKYPEGVDEADLNKTFTRTVYFKYTDKNGSDVFEPVKQEVHLTREAQFNYVTGEVEYTEWTTQTMESVAAKEKAGYTYDRASVDSLVLTGDSDTPADEYIIYTAIPETPVETPTATPSVTSTPVTTVSKTPSTSTSRTTGTSTGNDDKTGIFAAIGVGAAATIGGLAAFIRRRKKEEGSEE